MMEAQQSKMQRGFTTNSSAVNAALINSEAQHGAKDIGEPLKMVTLDACKAFDVVWQESLLRKIHNNGIQGKLLLASVIFIKVPTRLLNGREFFHPLLRLGKGYVRGHPVNSTLQTV